MTNTIEYCTCDIQLDTLAHISHMAKKLSQ